MDGLEWNTLLKWMIWGYHYFQKHPFIVKFQKYATLVHDFKGYGSYLRDSWYTSGQIIATENTTKKP